MTPGEPGALASMIGQSWADFVARDRRPATPHPYVYASAWRACARRMYLECVAPEQQPDFAPDLLARFRRGNDRERDLVADLARVGRDSEPRFDVIAMQERFELRDRKGRVALAGKVDGRLQINGARPPFEIKAWSPYLVDRIDTFDDLFDNPWTRGGAYQLLAYLLGVGEEYGFLILDRSGLPRVLDVELAPHLDRVETFLQRAEHVLDAIAVADPPPYIDDPAECHRCPFYANGCNPPEASAVPDVLTDPALEAALARREELKAAAHEFTDLDDTIKKTLRGVERAYCGPFELTGRWGVSTRVVLPSTLRKQYTETVERGRFTLTITKH